MDVPKHKVRESKKKTFFDRLKGSALFILFIIVLLIADTVLFVAWLSTLLSQGTDLKAIFLNQTFYWFIGLTVGLTLFFVSAWLVQRRAHGA